MTFLLRWIVILGGLAGLAYGAMWALATFVEPPQREMRQPLPPAKLVGKAP